MKNCLVMNNYFFGLFVFDFVVFIVVISIAISSLQSIDSFEKF